MAALAETPDEHREDHSESSDTAVKPEAAELASIGRLLGDRYRLERLVRGFGGEFQPEPELWIGVDELLNRKVGVELIATRHPLVEQVASAARVAAAVPDARFVQVLDAVQDEDLLYIVTEWVPGAEQLQDRLEAGPLTPAKATAMVRELAEAMVRAHEAEVAHGALNPATVMITLTNQVKLRGLLVEATLGGAEPKATPNEELYAADVLALGQIWYAALTARWPAGSGEYGLEAAPSDGAEPYTPAQILAAVPKQVDAAVCRVLGLGGAESVGTVKELTDLINSLPRLRDEVAEPTAALPRTRSGRPATAATQHSVRDASPGDWTPRTTTVDLHRPVWQRRGVLAVAACAVVALATLAAFQLSGSPANNNDTAGNVAGTTPHPSQGGTVSIPAGSVGSTLSISGATVWDSDPSQSSINAAPSAYNPSSSTGWQTTTQYKSVSFTGSYSGGSGIGLIFNLGAAHTVDQAKFRVATAGANVEVLTGNAGASASPAWSSSSGPSGYTAQKTVSQVSAGSDITVAFSQVSTQYVMILFTTLPYQGQDDTTGTPAGYRDALIDVRVYGA